MTQWPSTKARRVYAALLSVGWQLKRQPGSHRTLSRNGYPDFVFAFHDGEEIGPLERTERHGGPRLAAALASWPVAQLGR